MLSPFYIICSVYHFMFDVVKVELLHFRDKVKCRGDACCFLLFLKKKIVIQSSLVVNSIIAYIYMSPSIIVSSVFSGGLLKYSCHIILVKIIKLHFCNHLSMKKRVIIEDLKIRNKSILCLMTDEKRQRHYGKNF